MAPRRDTVEKDVEGVRQKPGAGVVARAEDEALRDVRDEDARDDSRQVERLELRTNLAAAAIALEQFGDARIEPRDDLRVDDRRFASREQRVNVKESGELAVLFEQRRQTLGEDDQRFAERLGADPVGDRLEA